MKVQTDGFRDLYRIMQVHYLAEPEVIDGAYKRLSKKYHPDRNRDNGAEAKMKLINYAYAVLSDPDQRCDYDRNYLLRLSEREKERSREEAVSFTKRPAESAAAIIKRYFELLAAGDFDRAYGLISSEDQKFISKSEFVEWQGLVTGLYEIGERQFIHFQTYHGKATGNKNFTQSFEFHISMAERERTSGRVNQVEMARLVVLEKNSFKVYLGYRDIKTIIAKFQQMAASGGDLEEERADKQRLYQEIKREFARASRYHRPFSLVLLETVNYLAPDQGMKNSDYEAFLLSVTQEIIRRLRQTDSCGRWSRNRIMLILPETRVFAAAKTAQKIFDALRELGDQSHTQLTFSAGVVQYKAVSLEELLDLLYANTLAAKGRGAWRTVY
jgi:curved DNA-binding protein CbpA